MLIKYMNLLSYYESVMNMFIFVNHFLLLTYMVLHCDHLMH